MTETVVVFGATSYVGSKVVPCLIRRGYRVVGVSRGRASTRILLPDVDPHWCRLVGPDQVSEELQGPPAAVVNFAFVKGFDEPQRVHRHNRQLLEAIGAAAGRRGRVIQISTSAVFGYAFEAEPLPGRVSRPRADLYAESKLAAEHLSERISRRLDCELAIVRLGNVIGPGSPIWVAGLAQQMLEAKPLGYEDEGGFCNATHVGNIGDYVAHLIGAPPGALGEHGRYHHLAEFSNHRWPEILDVIGAEMGLHWLRTPRPQSAPPRPPHLKRAAKKLYLTGAAGRYARTAFGQLPEWGPLERAAERLRTPVPPSLVRPAGSSEQDPALLDVLRAPCQFRSHLLSDWRAPVDFPVALTEIRQWLADHGYTLDPDG